MSVTFVRPFGNFGDVLLASFDDSLAMSPLESSLSPAKLYRYTRYTVQCTLLARPGRSGSGRTVGTGCTQYFRRFR
jgi:hypothetical protein